MPKGESGKTQCSLRSPRPRTRRRPADHLGSTKMTEKICPECNREGVVDQGTEDEKRCPTCNGSGVVPDDGQGSDEVWNTHPERAMSASRIG
jgi:DnaJ-class molecular chaperone